jgi:hypothetical protein
MEREKGTVIVIIMMRVRVTDTIEQKDPPIAYNRENWTERGEK